jgi:hypothetical protein
MAEGVEMTISFTFALCVPSTCLRTCFAGAVPLLLVAALPPHLRKCFAGAICRGAACCGPIFAPFAFFAANSSSVPFILSQFFFQPLSHDAHDFVVRLTPLSAHVAGAGNDAQILRAAMLREQVKITDRMLVVFLAIDAE